MPPSVSAVREAYVPAECLKRMLKAAEVVSLAELSRRLGLPPRDVSAALQGFMKDGQVELLQPVGGATGFVPPEDGIFFRWRRSSDSTWNRPLQRPRNGSSREAPVSIARPAAWWNDGPLPSESPA